MRAGAAQDSHSESAQPRVAARLSLLLVTTLVGFAILPSGAAALTTRMYTESFGAFQNPQSIAVDQSNGDIYVLDAGAKTVSRFNSGFAPKAFPALNTHVIDGSAALPCTGSPSPNCDQVPFNGFSFGTFGGAQVAIDNSGNPSTDGQIYITDSTHRLVDVFAPTGAFVGSLSQTGSAGEVFGELSGVAVDANGALYIADVGKGRIHKFNPTSSVPANSDFVADFPLTQSRGLAVGVGSTSGNLFVRRNSGVTKLSTEGVLQYQVTAGASRGVAVDPSTGFVLVAGESQISEFDASGAVSSLAVGAFGAPQISNAGGVAVDGTLGRAYVSEANGKIYVYGPPVPPAQPAVALGPHISPSSTAAGLVGYVDPGGLASTYYFEFGTADCAVSTCARVPASPAAGAAVGKGFGPVRVSQRLSGLSPSTTYHYRLIASNSTGTTTGAGATFTTLAAPSAVDCANSARRAEQQTTRLPDCRAYELVTEIPELVRNGIDVALYTGRSRAAIDGGAFQFTSLGGGADVANVLTTAEYMAVRGTGGWSVHGITPSPPRSAPAQVINGRETRYLGPFTDDLSKAVFRSDVPLTDEGPNVREIYNLYRRDDLLAPGPGTYSLLSDAATLQSPHPAGQSSGEDQEIPKVIGASSDLSQVVFESPRDLTASAAGLAKGPRLYKWSHGSVSLVGVLPSSEGGGPSISQAGQGAVRYASHAVSVDGSRVLFTAPPFDEAGIGGRLYLRDDQGTPDPSDDTTVKINASEKTNGGGPDGADPNGARAAVFWDATPDTKRIFFTTSEALTDDAPIGVPFVSKLYRYDLDAAPGQRLTLLSVDGNPGDGNSAGAEGVIGVSDDGSYVYFVGSNQLVPGLPTAAGPRIFLWRDGVVEQVATLSSSFEQTRVLGAEGWGFLPKASRVSADGRHLIFVTDGTDELVGYDHGTVCTSRGPPRCDEVYLYSAAGSGGDRARLSCASCRPNGQAASADAEFNTREGLFFTLKGFVGGDRHLNRAISSDGRHVFFTSGEAMSSYDENQSADVYDFDSATGMITMLSGGRPNTASYFLDASSDGSDVFFATRSQLLARDANENVDVYNARVGGGFEEPTLANRLPCESEAACRPPTAGSIPGADPESARALPSARPDGRRNNRAVCKKRRQRKNRAVCKKRRQRPHRGPARHGRHNG